MIITHIKVKQLNFPYYIFYNISCLGILWTLSLYAFKIKPVIKIQPHVNKKFINIITCNLF